MAVASWLVHLTLGQTVRIRALAGGIVLCFWARYFTLKVPLSTQGVEGGALLSGWRESVTFGLKWETLL